MATIIGTTSCSVSGRESFTFTPPSGGYIYLKFIESCGCNTSACGASVSVGGLVLGTATQSQLFEVKLLEEHTITFSEQCCAEMEVLFSPEVPELSEGSVEITNPLIEDCNGNDALSVLDACLLGELQALRADLNARDVVDPEKITYCNSDTGTVWVKACVFTVDGETQDVTETVLYETDTGQPCGSALPQVDLEEVIYCNLTTTTQWRRVYRYVTVITPTGTDTTEEIISDTDLNIPCEKVVISDMVEISGLTGDLDACSSFNITFDCDTEGELILTNKRTGKVTTYVFTNGNGNITVVPPLPSYSVENGVLDDYSFDATNCYNVYIYTLGCDIII